MGVSIDRFLAAPRRDDEDEPPAGTTATARLLGAGGVPAPPPPAETATSRLLTGAATTERLQQAAAPGRALDADRAARVIRLEGRTGLPGDLIARNLDAIEAEARRADFDPARFRQSSPVVAAWLAEHPDHLALARDDLTRLSYLERQLGTIGAQFQEGRATVELARIGEAAIRGTITPAQRERQQELEQRLGRAQRDYGITGFFEGIPGAIANQVPIFAATLAGKAKGAAVGGVVGAAAGAAKGATAGAIGAAVAGQAGPQAAAPEELVTVPAAALAGARAGARTGAKRGATLGWRVGGAVEAARLEGSLAYLEFESLRDEDGLPLDRATLLGAAAIVGAVNGGLELVGVESLAQTVPGIRALGRQGLRRALLQQTTRQAFLRYARTVGTAMAAEGLTEGVQSLVTHVGGELATMVADDSLGRLSAGAILDRLFSDAALSEAVAEGRAGAQGGGGLAAGTGAASLAVDVRRARQAQQDRAVFEALGTATQGAGLVERLPAKLQEVVERLTANGPLETVYAPVEAFTEYWQSAGVDAADVAEELGVGDAYEEALRTGGDLAIPTARYAATIAPTEHHSFFLDELRADPTAMNAREAREFGERMDALETEASEDAEPVEAPAATVGSAVAEQLTAAGFDASAAESYASLYEAAFRTLGQRAGVDPLELFNRHGLTIQRPDMAPTGTPLQGRPVSREALVARALELRAGLAETALEREAIQDEGAHPYAIDPDRRDLTTKTEAGEWAYARTPGGTLRTNLATVSVDGLLDELARAYSANAQENVAPTVLDNAAGDRPHVGMKGAAVNASGRKAARQKTIAKLEAELERRGVSAEAINDGLARMLIGEAMPAEDPTAFDFGENAPFFQGGRVPGQAPLAGLEQGAVATAETAEDRETADRRILARQVPVGAPGVQVEPARGGIVRVAARDEAGQPIALLSLVPTGQGQTADVLGVYVVPERRRQGIATALYDAADAAGWTVVSGASGFTPEGRALAESRGVQSFNQPAFHGSPHIFDKFSLHKIGTGEGAQAYGWGLYFAGRKKVAEFYRDQLTPDAEITDWRVGSVELKRGGKYASYSPRDDSEASRARSVLAEALLVAENDIRDVWEQGGDESARDAVLDLIDEQIDTFTEEHPPYVPTLRAIRKSVEQGSFVFKAQQEKGRIYTVEIPDDGSYILWDRPLSEQPEAVRAALLSGAASGDRHLARLMEKATGGKSDNFWQDGAEFYRSVVSHFAQDAAPNISVEAAEDQAAEAASRFLASLGINGIKYLDGGSRTDGEGSYNYVVFDDQLIKITEFEQRAEQGPRGRIQIGADRRMAIDLFERADLSTFLHESGHFYLEVLGDLATAPGAPADITADYATLLAWLGVEDRAQITREHHEKFARGFEAYLFAGQAPTSALRAAFARFRAWLVSIYRSVRALNVTVPDDVRQVFDRLLATEEEIAAAQAEQGQLPLFPDPAAVGMSEAEAQRYREAVTAARQTAEETLAAQLVARVERERTAIYRDARAKMRAEVAQAVNEEPVSLAVAVLGRGTLPDGSPLPEGVEPVKLDRAALLADYAHRRRPDERPGDFLRRLPRPVVYAKVGGVHPDVAAALFGFDSGDALLEALLTAESPRRRIERLTDERMRAEFDGGDLLTSGELATEAMAAVHNERRAQLLRTELQHLARQDLPALKGLVRRVTRRVPPLEAVRAEAERTIARKRVREIRPLLYQRAEAKAARAAVDALMKGDVELAFEEKQRELWNHELYRAATAARETVDGIVTDLARYTKDSTRARIGKAGGDYLAQIDAILARYDLARSVSLRALDRRQALRAFVAEQEADGIPLSIPEHLLAEAGRQHYQETTLEELVGVRDAVHQIAHLARTKNRLLASARARDLTEARAEILAALGASFDLTAPPVDLNPSLRDRFIRGVQRFAAEHTRMEFLFRWLDGGQATGTLWSYFFKPFADAEAAEIALRQQDAEALARIFGAYTPAERRALYTKRLHIPAASTGRVTGTLTKANLLAMALNWGNPYNRDALLRGYGWTAEQVEAALGHLDARDWGVVQAVWDHLEARWPAIAAQEQALVGLVPEKVEAAPFAIRSATNPLEVHELTGGYYPVKFDGDLSTRQHALDEKATVPEMFGGNWARAQTRHGHTIARTDTGGKPLRLELGVIGEHLAQVAHDLTHRPAVLDVHRLLHDPEIQAALEIAAGRDGYRQLNPWLIGIAGDRGTQQAVGVERAFGHLRLGATVVGLGFRVTSALAQTLGFLNTVNEIGVAATARGVAATLGRGPRGLARQWQFIAERSAMMRDRRTGFDRDVRDYVRKQNAVLPDVAAYFTFIGWLDLAVSIPSWLGAYGKAMDGQAEGVPAGDEAAAIDYADMVVRTTQAAGAAKDLAAVQRGGEFQRLFTMFYSSMNVLFNQMQQAGQSFGRTKDVPQLVASLALLWFLPAVLDDLMKGRGPDDEDDEGWLAWVARQELLYPFGTLVGVRDVASAVDWSLQTGQRSFDGSPVFGAGEAVVGSLLALVKAANPDADVSRRDYKELILTVGYLAHLPTSQLWTTAEYLHDVLTGLTDPTGPLDFLWRAATSGTPREDR